VEVNLFVIITILENRSARHKCCACGNLVLSIRLFFLLCGSSIPHLNTVVFSFRAQAFFYLGTICRFLCNSKCVSHWRFHDNCHMSTSADVSKFKIVPVHVKCWILLKPVLGGVDGSLHLTVPPMNRLNQSELATVSVLPCWAFFRDSYLLYYI
jgi:hypothetical protein